MGRTRTLFDPLGRIRGKRGNIRVIENKDSDLCGELLDPRLGTHFFPLSRPLLWLEGSKSARSRPTSRQGHIQTYSELSPLIFDNTSPVIFLSRRFTRHE